MVNTTNEPQDKAIHRGEPNHGSVAKNDTTLDILQDLIAELRNKHCAEPESRLQCQWCESDWPCPEARAADRAKQRLREVSGE